MHTECGILTYPDFFWPYPDLSWLILTFSENMIFILTCPDQDVSPGGQEGVAAETLLTINDQDFSGGQQEEEQQISKVSYK